jgi:hypothetical protein
MADDLFGGRPCPPRLGLRWRYLTAAPDRLGRLPIPRTGRERPIT